MSKSPPHCTKLLLLAHLLGTACAPLGTAVRPDAPTASQALGETSCATRPEQLAPLVVDWPSSQRAEIEAAMRSEVPIIAYDCKTIRVLPDCHLAGGYGYLGFTTKEDVVRLETADEVRTNLTRIGGTLAPQLGADLNRGASIDIATIIVGRRRTTREQAAPSELRGQCDGATHFIRGAHLGAFAMDTGSRANARAAADIFVGSAAATATAAQLRRATDGVAAECKTAKLDDSAPPSQCGAIIRLELGAVGAPPAGAAGTPPGESARRNQPAARRWDCPTGFVYVSNKCAPKDSDGAKCLGPNFSPRHQNLWVNQEGSGRFPSV
jgi:hypothetical protein